jgi:hypothetical protein
MTHLKQSCRIDGIHLFLKDISVDKTCCIETQLCSVRVQTASESSFLTDYL